MPQDIAGDAQRDDRIDQPPVVKQDQRARHDHGDRPQRVGQVVQERRADVHAVLRHAKDERRCDRVDGQRHARDDNDRPALNILRIEEALHAFGGEVERDDDERGVVDQGRHHLGPAVAEGHRAVGGPAGDAARGKGDDKRQRVGKVVDRVRHQRERARDDARDNLDDREEEVDRDGEPDAPVAAFRVEPMVVVVVMRQGRPPLLCGEG